MGKIEKIANDVIKITKEDIEEVNAIIQEQKSYTHPFKMATVDWQNQLAEHNQAVLDATLNLKAIIESGKTIKNP